SPSCKEKLISFTAGTVLVTGRQTDCQLPRRPGAFCFTVNVLPNPLTSTTGHPFSILSPHPFCAPIQKQKRRGFEGRVLEIRAGFLQSFGVLASAGLVFQTRGALP